MADNPSQWSLVKDYFVFSKGQRRAFIILCVALGLCVFLPALNNYLKTTVSEKADPLLIQQLAGLKVYSDSVRNSKYQPQDQANFALYAEPGTKNQPGARFFFDPNTATINIWQKLGVRDKTISTIQKYQAKGGHFYQADDLKKIYGFRQDELESLLPFVRIANQQANTRVRSNQTDLKPGTDFRKVQSVDVNLGDTTDYKRLPGIGSKLAARIVNFRSKLGGFYSIEQVGETFGLPDSTFQNIRSRLVISSGPFQKRNINTGTADELRMPYIPFNVANAIVQYRAHNGNFTSVQDLNKIPLIDEPLFKKIAPYLTTE